MIKRQILPEIRTLLRTGKSLLLLGPRQTGKTTLLKSLSCTRYISLAKARNRLEYEKDPSRLERELLASADKEKKLLIVIDEIQKVPALMDQLQDLIDEKVAQFVLTGSSARKLKKSGEFNLLPGRLISLRMDALSLAELQGRSLEDHLLFGDLPEVALTSDVRLRSRLLRSYVETYLEEEVKAEALVRGIGLFARFLEFAAIESGRVTNLAKISREIGVSIPTISNYYDVLVDCLVAERIDPITHSASRKKLTRSSKYLFYDMGVRRVAAREGLKLIPERMGELFEQWAGLEMVRAIRNRVDSARLRFWRDPDGPEVDWVVDIDGQFTPVEVKWTDSPRTEHGRHIETFIREHSNSNSGFVICRVSRPQRLSRNVTAIPWQDLDERILGL